MSVYQKPLRISFRDALVFYGSDFLMGTVLF